MVFFKQSMIISALLISSAFAKGYRSAGCGLGSMIIEKDGFVQVFALTTNTSFNSQLFGITSGTSNCGGSGGYAKDEIEQEMYVTENYDVLRQESAQGSGEHLNALATLVGCKNDQFALKMKKHYRSISTGPEQMLETIEHFECSSIAS